MEYESLLNNARWEILQSISKGRASSTELAKSTKSSLPNVSQQMKLLEAYDLVEYVKDERKGQGKPRQLYQLKREFCHLTYARQGFAQKRFFNPDAYHQMIINILFVPNLQDHPFLHKFLINSEELLQNSAIAYVKSTENEIDLFVLTEKLDVARNKYANTFTEVNGKTKKIITWSHNLHEIHEGLKKKDQYFENMLKNPIVIHDPKNQFEKIER